MTSTPDNNLSKPNKTLINEFRVDMFGRTKVADGITLFDSQHRYKPSGDYSDTTTGTASISYNANQSTEILTIGTASGDKVTRESRRVFPYQPGKSLQVMQTFVFAPGKTNLRQRAGYFSRQNGIYVELDGTTAYIVLRSYTTGQVVETKVPQSEWNTDKFDGTGPSDISLDFTKGQIFFQEYEWLGLGSVRIGFAHDGYFLTAHQFNHTNYVDSVYMTTVSLPIRYEIENTGTTSSSSSMKQICATVISNGGYQRHTESWSAARSSTVNVSSDFYPLVSIRMATGRTDSVIIPTGLTVLPIAQGNYEWALLRNATVTGGTWLSHTPSTGNVEYNISATSLTGGIAVLEGLMSSSNQANTAVTLDGNLQRWDLQLGRTNADVPVSDSLTLAIRSLGGTQSAIGAISWSDFL
jgi:hypothetical protein